MLTQTRKAPSTDNKSCRSSLSTIESADTNDQQNSPKSPISDQNYFLDKNFESLSSKSNDMYPEDLRSNQNQSDSQFDQTHSNQDFLPMTPLKLSTDNLSISQENPFLRNNGILIQKMKKLCNHKNQYCKTVTEYYKLVKLLQKKAQHVVRLYKKCEYGYTMASSLQSSTGITFASNETNQIAQIKSNFSQNMLDFLVRALLGSCLPNELNLLLVYAQFSSQKYFDIDVLIPMITEIEKLIQRGNWIISYFSSL